MSENNDKIQAQSNLMMTPSSNISNFTTEMSTSKKT